MVVRVNNVLNSRDDGFAKKKDEDEKLKPRPKISLSYRYKIVNPNPENRVIAVSHEYSTLSAGKYQS